MATVIASIANSTVVGIVFVFLVDTSVFNTYPVGKSVMNRNRDLIGKNRDLTARLKFHPTIENTNGTGLEDAIYRIFVD